MGKIADAFGSDDCFGPVEGQESFEFFHVEGLAAIIDKGSDAVFFHFSTIVFVVVMVVLMFVSMIVFVLVVVFVYFFVMVVVFAMKGFGFKVFFGGRFPFEFLDPFGG